MHMKQVTRVLFVDFDGCLHPLSTGVASGESSLSTPHFGWLPALTELLHGHEDVAIVIHSTWRYMYDVEELRELLGSLGSRVVGVTPRGPRFDSILWWVYLSRCKNYRIIDDDAGEFPDPPPPELILCCPLTGVSAPPVRASLKRWLDEAQPQVREGDEGKATPPAGHGG